MTRSLAENYPYSFAYKANIRGARQDWIQIVEAVEGDKLDSSNALMYLLSLLMNHAADFEDITESAIATCNAFNKKHPSKDSVLAIICSHMNSSD